MTDFTRINAPRVSKIKAMIGVIRKSAHSNKIGDEEAVELLAPVASLVCRPTTEVEYVKPVASAEAAPKSRPVWRDPPHQDQIARFVADVPREHLPSYITHFVNRLCEQAEQTKTAA